jgi:ppGpp synthetase/RelA/SpoT-type nucleotidyltranferase
VNANLRYYIKKAGAEPEVTQRLKRFSTIAHKLEREPTMALSSMEDIGGVRAILPTQEQVIAVCDMLDKADRWKIRRRRFYIEGGDPGPKDDGYRAVHLVVAKDGCYVEIQLRTPWQDAWAQSVEHDTRRLRADLKFGAGPDDLRDYYRLVSDYFAMRQAGVEPDQEFMETLAKQYAATRRYFPSS